LADTKITGLSANTAPLVTDLLAIVDDPGGTPTLQKMAISYLLAMAVTNVTVQVKTSGSGNYTPTTGMKKVLIILVGGGGGGAGVTGVDCAGGGGGGGGTCIRLCTAAEVGASKAYVVGAASAQGGAGNTSTFDVNSMQATGGGEGSSSADSITLGTLGAAGAGGIGSGGDLNIAGQAGFRGVIYSTTVGVGGAGGSSMFGGGGPQAGPNAVGINGGEYGGGGGGAACSEGTDRAGSTGAAGVMYCIEFLNV
jgi:hypothetical protein